MNQFNACNLFITVAKDCISRTSIDEIRYHPYNCFAYCNIVNFFLKVNNKLSIITFKYLVIEFALP